jgi:hypothetical protein
MQQQSREPAGGPRCQAAGFERIRNTPIADTSIAKTSGPTVMRSALSHSVPIAPITSTTRATSCPGS